VAASGEDEGFLWQYVDGENIRMSSDAQGDILYFDGTDYARLGYGTSGDVLTTGGSSANPAWATPTTGDITGVTAGTGLSGGGTSGAVTLNVEASQTQITAVGTIATGVWNGTDVAVADGGTGGGTASAARTNLGVAIGSDVQAYDAQLADVAGLAVTDGGVIVGDGSNFVLETGATTRTSLGLAIGSDVQAYDADTAKLDVDQSWSGTQRGTPQTITQGTLIDLDTGNNFLWTPAAADELSFTNETTGQSGFIKLINPSGYAITKESTVKASSTFLADVTTAGTYLVTYFSDGTNVYVSASAALS